MGEYTKKGEKIIEYTPRFYPLGIRGGRWVELWNMGVEVQREWDKYYLACLSARVDDACVNNLSYIRGR